jgi:type III pantothenate kinase
MTQKTQKTWLIDIGNSTIVYCEKTDNKTNNKFKGIHQLSTDSFDEMSDTFPFTNNDILVVSSVVPKIDPYFSRYSNIHFLNATTIKGITINIKNPNELGADRLANALGAFITVKQACLIIDSGTALTFCYVDQAGIYQGGAILPGLGIASKSLQLYTAKIPLIHVAPQKKLFGKTTTESVQTGLYNGYFHLISGLISDYRKMNTKLIVIGTGTGLDIYENQLDLDHYMPMLIFEGLSAFCKENSI